MYFFNVYTLLVKSVYTFVKSVYTFKSTSEVHKKCITNSYRVLAGFMNSYDILHHPVSKTIPSSLGFILYLRM